MAVFIRNLRTGRWYAGYNQWVTEATRAFDFRKPKRAIQWVGTVHLGDAEVVQSSAGRIRKIAAPRTDPSAMAWRKAPAFPDWRGNPAEDFTL